MEFRDMSLISARLLLEINKVVYHDTEWSIVIGIPNYGTDRDQKPVQLLIQTNGPGFTTLAIGLGIKDLIDETVKLRDGLDAPLS
jgi:hypothetical protein